MQPETRYAKSGDVNIAYQVTGEGPRDLVLVPGWVSHLEADWDHPLVAHFLNRLVGLLSPDPIRQAWDRPVGPQRRPS